jgi:hypothetical protein
MKPGLSIKPRCRSESSNGQLAARSNTESPEFCGGGSQPVSALEIRFNPEEDYVPVDRFQRGVNDPWSFWSQAWTPQRAGTYMIRLRVKEPRVRARKMDAGYYLRTVEIKET